MTTIDFRQKSIVVNNKPVKLSVWDTAGSEKYRSVISMYFKGCHGIILVFDLSKYDIILFIVHHHLRKQCNLGISYPSKKLRMQYLF